MIWFIPLSPRYAGDWFLVFLVRLLENDAATLRLLRRNPFPDAAPEVVRARLFHYRYSTWREWRETGRWWVRTLAAEYVPPFGLADVGAGGRGVCGDRRHWPGRRGDAVGRDRRRLRPERARRGDHAGSGGSPGHGPRGGRRARWRVALGRADAARVRPRRLQLDPRLRPDLAVLRRRPAGARGARPALDPTAGGARPPARRRLRRPAPWRRRRDGRAGWAATATRTATCSAGWSTPAPTLLPDLLGPFHVPLSPPRALRMARFGLLGLQPATRVARRFRGDAARALFAGIAAHSILPLTEPVSAAAGLVLGAAAHVDGWPFPEGGAGNAAARARRRAGGARRADRDGPAGGQRWTSCRPTGSRCSTRRRAASSASPGTASRPAIGAGSRASATDRASSSSTSRSTAPSRGARRSCSTPRPSTSVARSRRSPAARPRSPPAASRIGRSCC